MHLAVLQVGAPWMGCRCGAPPCAAIVRPLNGSQRLAGPTHMYARLREALYPSGFLVHSLRC